MAISFTILGNVDLPDWEGTVPDSIGEVTLLRFIKYNNDVVPSMPQSMKLLADMEQEMAEANANLKKSVTLREQIVKELRDKYNGMLRSLPEVVYKTEWLPYYEREVQFWSGFPDIYKGKINIDSLMEIRTIISNLLSQYEPNRSIELFEFEGEKYFLPKPGLSDGTLIELVEAAQFEHHYNNIVEKREVVVDEIGLKIQSRWNSLLPIICLLCRKEDERSIVKWYERNNFKSPSDFFDDLIRERKELFAQLPMNIALDVFFSFSNSKVSSFLSTGLRSEDSIPRTLQQELKDSHKNTAGS